MNWKAIAKNRVAQGCAILLAAALVSLPAVHHATFGELRDNHLLTLFVALVTSWSGFLCGEVMLIRSWDSANTRWRAAGILSVLPVMTAAFWAAGIFSLHVILFLSY